MTSQQHYIESDATRKRKRRERAATPTPRKGLTVREWQAMPEPDPIAEPARHETWSYFQTNRYEESAMPTEPNVDAVKQHSSRAAALAPAAVRVLNRYNKTLSKVRRLDVPEATRLKLRDLAKRDADEALTPLRQDWATIKSSVVDLTDRALRPQAGDTASELRTAAAWTRAARILDRAEDRYGKLQEMAAAAEKQGDGDMLAALWREGPGYAEAEGWPDADKMRDLLAEVAAPEAATRANAERKAFDRGAGRVDLSFAQAEHALSGEAGLFESSGADAFPGWSADEFFTLQPETSDERDDDDAAALRALMR